jgi:hypothetical protein
VVIFVMTMIRLVFVPEYRYNFTVMPLIIILFSWLGIYILQKIWAYIEHRRTA